MADKRAFAVFDVGYLDNPKISDVFDASPIAVCMHFASVLYSAQHLTDGFIALRTMQRKAGGTAEDSRILIDAGLWHEPGHACEWCPEVPEGKVYVHDYTEHNRTSEGVKQRSSTAKDNANARWEKARQAKAAADASGNATGIANPDNSQCLDRQTDRQKNSSSPDEAKKRPTPLPKDWAPTAAHIERAKEKRVNVLNQAEAFKLHAETHDRRAANWNAAFTTWLMKSKPEETEAFDPKNWMNRL